jgi:hypothetical protein
LGCFYSERESEWLFLEYQNVPVRQDGPYVMNDNNTRYAIYINGDGKAASKVLRKKVTKTN